MTIQYKLEDSSPWEEVKVLSCVGKATRKYSQNHYLDRIPLTPEQSRQHHCSLPKEETTLLTGALGKLNWIPGMSRHKISFHVCEISTKIKIVTIVDIISVNEHPTLYQNTVI